MVNNAIVIGVVVVVETTMEVVDAEEAEGHSIPGTHAMNVVKLDITQGIVVEEEVVEDVDPLHLTVHVDAPHQTAGPVPGAGLVQGEQEEEVQNMETRGHDLGLCLETGNPEIVLGHGIENQGTVLCHEIGKQKIDLCLEIKNQGIVLLHHAKNAHVLLRLGGTGHLLQKIMVEKGLGPDQIQDKKCNAYT